MMFTTIAIVLVVSAMPQSGSCWNQKVYDGCKVNVNACWAEPWKPSNQAKCQKLEDACQQKARVCGQAQPQVKAPATKAPAAKPSAPKPPAPKPNSVKADSVAPTAPKPAAPPAAQGGSSARNRFSQKASTTRYGSSVNGACEFNTISKGPAAAINHESYFPDTKIPGHPNIGVACNTCWVLSAKGVSPVKITITDQCPDAGWCTMDQPGGVNSAGYKLHFDLNFNSNYPAEWKALDNPIVDAQPVDC